MPGTRKEEIASLMRDTGRAHHLAFIATNGEDPEWPRWYARHLAKPLGALLGQLLEESVLEADLIAVDAEHRSVGRSEDWSTYYARWFLDRLRDHPVPG